VDIDTVTEKYTRQRLGLDTLTAAGYTGDPMARWLAHAIGRAAEAVLEVEADLARAADSVSRAIEAVCETVAAPAGQPVRSLNPLGELQANGPRFDALIAVRHDRIAHLRVLTRLGQQLPATAETPAQDLAQAMAALGFQPITPAHPSTHAAYGHRQDQRHVDVSLGPFGQPGIEINASDADTVVWSATFGPDVPVPVLAAVLRAATNPAQPHPNGRSPP